MAMEQPNPSRLTALAIGAVEQGDGHALIEEVCPETVLFEAGEADYWASEFTTISRTQRIGILGEEGFWAGVTCTVTRLIASNTANNG